jgi:hypothetical protein
VCEVQGQETAISGRCSSVISFFFLAVLPSSFLPYFSLARSFADENVNYLLE